MQTSLNKPVLLICILLLSSSAGAQDHISLQPDFAVSFDSYASTVNSLPFWSTANQNGAFTSENNYYQLLRAGFAHEFAPGSLNKWDFTYGTTIIAGYNNKTDLQLNQYWVGTRYKWLDAKIGARNDSVRFAGLSHTNGNMIWSGNSRPLTGIMLSTNGFISIFSHKKCFTVKALYEENFLLDKRDIINAVLHHKYLYGRANLKQWKFTLGLDHWVYWGGTSRSLGKSPGIEYYFRYILALKGGEHSSASDQKNAAGNSIGMYVVEVEKSLQCHLITFYWNHPFEDRSGLELANLPDGLWGLHFHRKIEGALVGDIVYEFMSTLNQSGSYHLIPSGVSGVRTGRGRDNYFNLGPNSSINRFYSSGHVYYNRMMGTPLFIPTIGTDGISKGFDNTRIEMHHLGIGGTIINFMNWKSLLTWSRSFGTYESPYPKPLDQFSWLVEWRYRLMRLPLSINLGVAGDNGDRFERRLGAYVGMSCTF